MGPRRVGPRRVGPRTLGPRTGGLEGWEAQNFALFFPLPQRFSFILPSLGGLEAPAAPKPSGFHTTAREPKRAHLRVPTFKNTTKIPLENPQEREERMKMGAGESKKKAKFWAVRRRGVRRVRRRVVSFQPKRPFLLRTPLASAECVRSVLCCAVVSVTIEHGQKQEWVLEDNLSQAVWRTILRGPRPPPGSWQCGTRQNSSSTPARGTGGFNQGRAPLQQNRSRVSQGPVNSGVAQPPQRLSPDERVSEARARVLRLEAALQVLEEDSPEGLPIKEALKKARDQCRALPIGERLDSTLKFVQRSRARIEKIQADLTREQHLLQQALESLQRLRDEAINSVPDPSPNGRPPVPMDVENSVEEVRRLRAQVADLQQERALGQETDESRAKKARTLSVPTPALGVGPAHGVGGSSRASDVMQTLIDAADSTLKEVRNV